MLRSALIGVGTALLGLVATLLLGMLWMFVGGTRAANENGPSPTGPGEQMTVSFSPLGFIHHFWWIWWVVVALGVAGFLVSAYLQKRWTPNG